MDVPVRNQNGDTVETIELDDAVFDAPMNHALVHQALVIYQLNKRQGTHDTKTRAQVSGGGRKPWIQKHTGRARQGSIRAPQWRHGGVVFGPHPRSYRKGLPRRMRRQALMCVLSDKVRQERLVCLDSIDTVDGKTKSMSSLLQRLEISGSALVVTRQSEQTVVRAANNLGKVWTLPVALLNAHELLRRETVIMTVEAARWAEGFLAAPPQRGGGRSEETSFTPVDTVDEAPEAEAPFAPVDTVDEAPEAEAPFAPVDAVDEAPEAEGLDEAVVDEPAVDADASSSQAEAAPDEAVEAAETESLLGDEEDAPGDEPEAAVEPQQAEVSPGEDEAVAEEEAKE